MRTLGLNRAMTRHHNHTLCDVVAGVVVSGVGTATDFDVDSSIPDDPERLFSSPLEQMRLVRDWCPILSSGRPRRTRPRRRARRGMSPAHRHIRCLFGELEATFTWPVTAVGEQGPVPDGVYHFHTFALTPSGRSERS